MLDGTRGLFDCLPPYPYNFQILTIQEIRA